MFSTFSTHELLVSNDVIFHEASFPFKASLAPNSSMSSSLTLSLVSTDPLVPS